MSVRQNPYVETDPKVLNEHAMDIMVAATQQSIFTQLSGETNQDIIKTAGAKFSGANSVTMTMRGLMRGAGVKGNSDLESNRDRLNYLHMKVDGDVIANSILSKHEKIESKTIATNFRRDGKEGLGDWLGDKLDRIRFAKLSEDCTNIVAVKADGTIVPANKLADTTDGLVGGDKFTTATIDEMLKRAEGGYIEVIAGSTVRHPRVRPYKTEIKNIKGKDTEVGFYLIIIGTESAASLGDDPKWLQAQEALTQADKSTFWVDGHIGQYKNAVICKKTNWDVDYAGVITSATADYDEYAGGFNQYAGKSGIITEVNLLLGASAGMQPFQFVPDYIEDSEDSGRKMVLAIDEWFGFEKTKFVGKSAEEKALVWHEKDYGVIAGIATVE